MSSIWNWLVGERVPDTGKHRSIADPRGPESFACPDAAPEFGNLNPDRLDEMFACKAELHASERAGTLDATLGWLGIADKQTWWQIEASFYLRHFGDASRLEVQAAYAQYLDEGRLRLSAQRPVATRAMLAPADGITVELWARAASRVSRCTTDLDAERALAQLGMTSNVFRRVDAEFRSRMRVDRSRAIATIYERALAPRRRAAEGTPAPAAHQGADGPPLWPAAAAPARAFPPCSFDDFVRLSSARGAWEKQGVNVLAAMWRVFRVTAQSLTAATEYWSQRVASEPTLARRYAMQRVHCSHVCAESKLPSVGAPAPEPSAADETPRPEPRARTERCWGACES